VNVPFLPPFLSLSQCILTPSLSTGKLFPLQRPRSSFLRSEERRPPPGYRALPPTQECPVFLSCFAFFQGRFPDHRRSRSVELPPSSSIKRSFPLSGQSRLLQVRRPSRGSRSRRHKHPSIVFSLSRAVPGFLFPAFLSAAFS